jgi:hypothetical protein
MTDPKTPEELVDEARWQPPEVVTSLDELAEFTENLAMEDEEE